MDFFEHQARARRTSSWLVFHLLLAVGLTVLVLYVVVAGLLFRFQIGPNRTAAFWNPDLFLKVAILTSLVIALGSLYKIYVLSRGGEVVARSLGGRPIEPNTGDIDERKLLNVVEEMAIASGIPVPTVYLLENEPSINAFAAGFTPSDAVIGVTHGAIEHLSRDELQGVIAHEFSHVFNGDMRLNLRLMGILHGILVIALIGYAMLRGSTIGRRRKEGVAFLLFALALLAIGSVGHFFGQLIKAAVSRQREFLADASAVQFTRNPLGVAGALKKIGGLAHGARIQSGKGAEVSHMLFANGFQKGSEARRQRRSGWLTTHPPLTERIRRIDPSFDGHIAPLALPDEKPAAPAEKATTIEHGPLMSAPASPTAPSPSSLPSDGLSQLVGNPSPEHVAFAAALLEGFPGELKAKAHEPLEARAVVLALLLSRSSDVRQSQFRRLSQSKDPLLATTTLDVSSLVGQCPMSGRLPLVDLCLPSLRRLSKPQYESFIDLVDDLVAADDKTELFEYTLLHVLRRHLDPHFRKVTRPKVRYPSLEPLKPECELLLSSLAHAGHSIEEEAASAFKRAADELGQEVRGLTFRKRSDCGLRPVRLSLEQLALTSHPSKRSVLRAAAASVSHDARVNVREGELLRAIADTLDCPLPPLVPGQVLEQTA